MHADGCSPPTRLVLALAALALGAGSADARAQGNLGDRLALARIQVSGPVAGLACTVGAARAELEGAFADGERVVLVLALPIADADAALAPALTWSGEGSATFAGWERELAQERLAQWSALPASLRNRPRVSAPGNNSRRAPLAAVWLAAGGALLALAARARARLAIACALVATASAAAYGALVRSTFPSRQVLEVDAGSGAALSLVCARSELRGVRADDLRWEVEPAFAPLSTRTARGDPALTLRGADVELRSWRTFDLEGRRLSVQLNRWGLLAPVWVRAPSGEWRRFGAWPAGLALADAGGEASLGPPGWSNPALPLGATIIIGRWDDAPSLRPGAGGEVWLRWVGF